MRTLLPSAGALALWAAMALAVDAPTKDGLWSIHIVNTITSSGTAAMPEKTDVTVSRCQGKDTPLQIPGPPPKAGACKVRGKGSSGNTTFLDMQCFQNGQMIRVKETVTLEGENERHTITDSTFDPPMNGVKGMKLVADWKYREFPARMRE